MGNESSSNIPGIASVFIFDPIKDFNMHIDAPAEKEEELYA